MNTVLLTAGVVAVLAAIIGGGLKAFNIEIPVLDGLVVRVVLGVLGAAFLLAAFVTREHGADPAEARYQRRVAATCEQIARLSSRESSVQPSIDQDAMRRSLEQGGVQSPTSAVSYDLDELLSEQRAKQLAIHRRFDLLLDKPAPSSLTDQADALRDQVESFVRHELAFRRELAALPERPTLDEVKTAFTGHQPQADDDAAQLEDTLTQLADHDCSLAASSQAPRSP